MCFPVDSLWLVKHGCGCRMWLLPSPRVHPRASGLHPFPLACSFFLQSTAWIYQTAEPVSMQKRASQACQQCRTRKIKCDVVEEGLPCRNCRLDGVRCFVPTSRRSRKYRLQQARHGRHELLSEESLTANVPHGAPAIPSRNRASSVNNSLTREGRSNVSTSTILAVDSLEPRINASQIDLPVFISPSSRIFEEDEIDFLRGRGAFTIPGPSLRNQLIRGFFLYAYPLNPVLDIQDFLDSVEGRSTTQVSLLLFHAVMLCGLTFVDTEHLRDAGYDTRLEAKTIFSQKVKVSYLWGS
jgi:hypothetical protein